jgi:hypothetical protein
MPTMEDILDQCLDAARSGGDPESILSGHPEMADEIRPLLGLATELSALPDPPPAGDGLFRALARLSLEQSRPRKVRLFSRPVLLRVAAGLVVVLLLGWSTVTASSSALPGDLLYPVKLFTERAWFSLAIDREDRAELRITFSEERLKEAVKQLQAGEPIDPQLLHRMLNEAESALRTGLELPAAGRDLVAARVANLSDLQARTLERFLPSAPPHEKHMLTSFIQVCKERCGWSCQMDGGPCPGCSSPGEAQEMMKTYPAHPEPQEGRRP